MNLTAICKATRHTMQRNNEERRNEKNLSEKQLKEQQTRIMNYGKARTCDRKEKGKTSN